MQMRACLSSAARYQDRVSAERPSLNLKGSQSGTSTSEPTSPPAKKLEGVGAGAAGAAGAAAFLGLFLPKLPKLKAFRLVEARLDTGA